MAYASGPGSTLDKKIRRLCEAFNAETFTILPSKINDDLKETEQMIDSQNKIVSICENSISEYFDFY